MRHKTSRVYLVPLLAGFLLAPPLALAQQDYEETQPLEQPQGAQSFDDQELERFADAYVEVGAIHEEYSGRLEQVADAEEAQEVQQEANDRMVEAIRNEGLEVQDYSEIAAALERDPEMRDRVVTMIEERQ